MKPKLEILQGGHGIKTCVSCKRAFPVPEDGFSYAQIKIVFADKCSVLTDPFDVCSSCSIDLLMGIRDSIRMKYGI